MIQTEHPDAWMNFSACSTTATAYFFSEDPADIAYAKALCAECFVAPQCREYKERHQLEYGIWGGISAVRKRRRRKTAA